MKNFHSFFGSMFFPHFTLRISGIYMKFNADVIRANTAEKVTYNYEMEPGKNVKFS